MPPSVGELTSPYLDQEMVQAIYASMGSQPPMDPQPPPMAEDSGVAEQIEEDIDDD